MNANCLTLLLVECFLDVYEGICDLVSYDAFEYFFALLALEPEKLLDALVHVRHACIQSTWGVRNSPW